jgi:hypothetical protein
MITTEQRKSYKFFTKSAGNVLKELENGRTLQDLANGCGVICGHTCSDGYESEICNVNRWINLLISFDCSGVLSTRIDVFIKYVLSGISKNDLELAEQTKEFELSQTDFGEYEKSIQTIIHLLVEESYSLPQIIGNYTNMLSQPFNTPDAWVYNVAVLLERALVAKIIPGDNLVDFLRFLN